MKILEAYAGGLTNFEVRDFLRSKGAGKDPTRLIASIAPSEHKVYDYLEQTAASAQNRKIVNEFVKECKNYDLAAAEILNVINIRPSSEVEIDPRMQCSINYGSCLLYFAQIIEKCENRFGENREKLVETMVQMLPPPPTEMEHDDGIGVDKEETSDGHQKEVAG